MDNLTQYQQSILDKLYSPLISTDPNSELYRIVLLYNNTLKNEVDEVILHEFRVMVEAKLRLVLSSNFRFYQKDHFIEKYSENLADYLEDNIDSVETDFILDCILEQEKITNNIFEYEVKVDLYPPVDVMQFVSNTFLDEFKPSSRIKIEFLKVRLEGVKINHKQEQTLEGNIRNEEYSNPYPDYFNSIGYEIFVKFLDSDIRENKVCISKTSFLVDQLRKDGLMNINVSQIKIFKFLVESFDLNLGAATKFKTDFSRDKYFENYQLVKNSILK